MSHRSSGLPVCFPSWGTRVQIAGGYLCETGILLSVMSCYKYIITLCHRWVSFLKHQSSLTIYWLPSSKSNFRFPFLFAGKQMEVAVFHKLFFPFAETWKRRHGERRQGGMRHGAMETWRHGDIKRKRETEAQAILPNPFAFLLCKGKFAVYQFVDEEKTGSWPICKKAKVTKRTCPLSNPTAHLCWAQTSYKKTSVP